MSNDLQLLGISNAIVDILAHVEDNVIEAIGLRSTGNRVMALLLPVLMGAIAEVWGLNATFYVTGGLLLGILIALGLWIGIRHPEAAKR